MQCTDCKYRTEYWNMMKEHYKEEHPTVKNVSKLFTKEAKERNWPPFTKENLVTWNQILYPWILHGLMHWGDGMSYGKAMGYAEKMTNTLTDAVAKQHFNMGTKYRKF